MWSSNVPPLSLRERAGVRGIERSENALDYAFRVLSYIVAPDTNHPVPGVLKERRALCVLFDTAVMSASIEFDDQSCVGAKEVDYVRPHRVLTSELGAF